MPARSSIRRRGKQSRPFMTDLSVDARLLASDRGLIPHINPAVVTFASALLAAGALALANAYTWRQGALFLLGGGLGSCCITRCSVSPRPGACSLRMAAVPDCAPRC